MVGGTGSTDPNGNEYPGIHAVLAFGENINILYNTVREVTYGKDHEAIYIKAGHSTIAHNVVHNGGRTVAAMAISRSRVDLTSTTLSTATE